LCKKYLLCLYTMSILYSLHMLVVVQYQYNTMVNGGRGGGVDDPWLAGRSVFIDDLRNCAEIKGEAFKEPLSHISISENHV
jgi:hypothetical protein